MNALASIIDSLRVGGGPLTSVSAGSTVAVMASAIAALIPLVAAGNAAGLFRFGWQSFLTGVGVLPSRGKVWGTVYDSNTKRPLPFAKVQLLDRSNRILETRIADQRGRYGFLTTPASLQSATSMIQVEAKHPGYRFPSSEVPTVDAFLYDNPYYGSMVAVQEDMLVAFDVPMDPERASSAPLLVKSPSVALGAATAAMADAGLWVGLVAVPLAFVLNPNPFTLGTLFLYMGTASLRLFGLSEHPFGVVNDSESGKAVPFSLISLNDDSGRRVAFAVSDEQGRYVLTVEPGSYDAVVRTPANILPARTARHRIAVKKGWVTQRLTL